MNLLIKLTAKEIQHLEEVSLTNAKATLREIKEYTNVDKPRLWHYFSYYKINYSEYCQMTKQSLIS